MSSQMTPQPMHDQRIYRALLRAICVSNLKTAGHNVLIKILKVTAISTDAPAAHDNRMRQTEHVDSSNDVHKRGCLMRRNCFLQLPDDKYLRRFSLLFITAILLSVLYGPFLRSIRCFVLLQTTGVSRTML